MNKLIHYFPPPQDFSISMQSLVTFFFSFNFFTNMWLIHINLYDLVHLFSYDLFAPNQRLGLAVDLHANVFLKDNHTC